MFVNALTVDEKHCLLNRDNLMEANQTQLYSKQKTFFDFLFLFLKSVSNFKYLSKKDDPHSWCISLNSGSGKYG